MSTIASALQDRIVIGVVEMYHMSFEKYIRDMSMYL